MITSIHSERLLVISDLHLGNPFSDIKKKTVQFIEWASEQGFDLCINGDGFEIAQVSMSRLAKDVPEVLQALKRAMKKGMNIYYVVGNHDIVFEHFLHDWGGFKVAPFLNVKCGMSRFRIEHGHLYDPFFIKSPRLYETCTWLGGFVLKLHPALYKAWIFFEKLKSKLRSDQRKGILGEPMSFTVAAEEILQRGFDAVVFGHTHHSGQYASSKGVYLNPGSWMLSSTYVLIEQGKIELLNWSA